MSFDLCYPSTVPPLPDIFSCSSPLESEALSFCRPSRPAREMTTRGVVTAADAAYFPNVQLLVQSLNAHTATKIAVFDLGFQANQRKWLLDRPNVQCLDLPRLVLLPQLKAMEMWQTWLKPMLLFYAPFDRVLWLDADTVVIGGIDDAFGLLDKDPLLTPDRFGAETQNDAGLYDHLPLPGSAEKCNWGLNAGVAGFCKHRDFQLLAKWGYAVQWATLNPDKRHLIRWLDQGALIWAIRQSGHEGTVRGDFRWNYPAVSEPDLVACAEANQRTLWDELRCRFPDVNILHWYGVPKLSQLLRHELGEERASAFCDASLSQP